MKLTLRIPRPTRSLMGLAALALAATTWAQTNPTPQALPYTQDFSSLAHSSTVYPAGWQGWAIGGNPGASYKTTGPTTDRVLEASGDAAGTSGNVYNYNGKIGFLNSGSLDPTVGLALNTTGFSSVQVVYDIATIRNPHNGGANTRINEVSLQYRVGNSGGWTTISGQEYQNNTTTQTNSGNTDPQNQQTKTVTLPNACDNQAEVQVRWASRQVSGSGSRPSFSVDNLNVSGSGLDNTSVSFATGSSVVSEGAGSTNLTVTISSFSTTQATTVDVAIEIGDPARVGNYTTQTVTFPANDGTPQNVPVTITDDGVYDGGATVIFILQNVTGGQGTPTIGTPLDHALTITENEPSPLVINEVDYDNPGSAEDMEFVEILNNGLVAIDLNGYQIELVNGSGGAPYSTITLPSFSLAPGAYYVVGNNASIPNINLVTGAPSMIQNGSPDAVALRSPSNDLLDVISYEGSVAAPYTEGTGLDVANSDDGTPGIGISRFPNGADINDNSVDWSRRCLSPGASNNSTFEFCICEPPTATATPQCIDDNTWEIVVDVTDLGSASSVDITNNVNGASAIGVGLGQHIIGPFNNNAVVDVLVHPDDTSFCDVNLPGNFMNCMPDCLGVPGGWDVPGAPCDDQDPNTVNDTWSPTCICEGAPPQPTVSFSLPFSAVAEDGVSLTIGLEMDMAPNAPVTVEVTDLFTGTATSGTDYAPIGTVQLTFLPEDFYPALMTFNVLITDDLDDEPAETFDLALDVTNGTATVGNGNFTGQIQDNDVPALVIDEVDYDNAGADNAEWIELKNTGAATIELENWTVELVNGNGGGAAVYKTIALPAFSLAAGGYYVIGNNASTPNINLVVTPASDLIQNGAPDAIGLRSPDNSLVDAISYEGNTGSPYLEGVGSPVAQADDNTTAAKVIARYLDGNDTDDNSTDWKMWCATPGTSNATVDGDGDLTADCLDGCPADPSKVAPGLCGCGVSDTPVTWYADIDADTYGDALNTTDAPLCSQPVGYVDNPDDCDDQDASRHPNADEDCDDVDDDCDGIVDDNAVDAPTWFADLDLDGFGDDLNTVVACDQPLDFVAVGGDCDDQDASRHPGADEDCDDVDDDCDGTADDNAVDAPTWFADLDLDGFGDDLNTVVACDQPLDFVAVGGDCDDQDASRHPGASEVCDDVDQDCDGLLDEDALDATTWFHDSDGDGFGDDFTTVLDCDQPLDFVAVGGDCDDQDASRHPGASEVCDDVDQDCDGLLDEDALDATTWFHDADGDGFGDDFTTVLDCDQPLDFVAVGGDCDDSDASRHPGATEVCDDADQDCDGLPDDNAVDATTWYADLDSDGYGDDLNTVVACDQPLDFVGVGGDCDDQDASRHPNADEDCDDVDDDCDGIVDDNAVDAPTWFADLDLDGFGDDLNTVVACDRPLDFVAVGGDCDDQDASRHPGASEVCDDLDRDCDGLLDEDALDATTWFHDSDGDGFGDDFTTVLDCDQPLDFVAVGGDCDDLDASRHPGASEVCDDVDQDCDGLLDEDALDATTWFHDSDGDGFGDDFTTVLDCDQPLDFVAVGGDCDDQDASRHPGASEVCDDLDQDCDGLLDEDALDATTWFHDSDGDGFGDDFTTVLDCDQPLDFVAVGGDCDDLDASRHPGADEDCDDVDDDCDGIVDDNAVDAPTWFADLDLDGFGDDLNTVVTCDQPLDFVAVGGDCDDQDASRHPGATEVCDDADQDCDGLPDDNAVDAPTWFADLDLDGFGDDLNTVVTCDQPLDFVAVGGDCDDQDASRHPNADEDCDDVDDDCDGTADDNAVDAPTWFADLDLDGFGDDLNTVVACDQPLDFVAVGGDCDDQDASRHPGATEVCDDADQDCDGLPDDNAVDAPTWFADLDLDGFGDDLNTVVACDQPLDFVAVGGDCDDQDASRHPGATEVCDDLDQDCDGLPDDNAVDATTWFADLDLDGFGDDLNTVVACDQPLDFVGVGGDCDDQDASRHPGATEVCDDADQDCDGLPDDNAVDAPTWFADLDLDGFGDDLNTVVACDQPLDFVAVGGDCDDQDASRHPGASEVCDDVDQDCDGLLDEDALDATTWFHDSDGDGFGDDFTTVLDCDQPLDFVAVGGDCDDLDASRHPGASEVCDDVDQDCDGLLDEDALDATTWFHDSDGDGFGDDFTTVLDCDQPLDFVAVGGDCDDQDASRHPGASEVCDDLDQDCDGTADDNAVDAPTWYRDLDGDGFGVANETQSACDQPMGYVSNFGDCNDADANLTVIGLPCDDGDAGTENDLVTVDCTCEGTPIDNCVLNEVSLELTTDATLFQTTWDIVEDGTNNVQCSGGGYPMNTTITATCCLADGCYDLRVFDTAGDGISPGGFTLRDANGERIIDNSGNGAWFSSQSIAPYAFCLPLGTTAYDAASCDVLNATPNTVLHVVPEPAVTALYSPSNSTTGYHYWIFNPHGGYNRRIVLSHAVPGNGYPGGTPANLRCSYLKLSQMQSFPVPLDVPLNIRVRTLINGVYGEFGPTCKLLLPMPACPPSQLTTTASPVVSCGATGLSHSSIIYAGNVVSATNYQFEFSRPGYLRRITSPTRAQSLNFYTYPLLDNTCYNVRVRVSFDDGTTYCPFGPYCTITLGSGSCNFFGMAPVADESDYSDIVITDEQLTLWPNPNDGSLVNIALDGIPASVGTVSVDVMDAFGKLVATRTIPAQGGYLKTSMSFERELAPGLYLINVRAGGTLRTQRLVIQ